MTELNVTPLMDLAFSLLIIFMISTPLLEQTIPVNLPQQDANSASVRPDIDFQLITIKADGKIYWGKQPVDLVELNSLLASLSKTQDPPAISLRADRNLIYQILLHRAPCGGGTCGDSRRICENRVKDGRTAPTARSF